VPSDPNKIVIDDPCVIFALARERRAFHREFAIQQRFPGAPCWARFCGPAWLSILVLETGVGAARTQPALDWLLQKPRLGDVPYQPKMILSAGYAGALQDGLAVGELVLATEVVDISGGCWLATWPGDLPPGPWKPPLRRGRLLTIPHMVADPAEKNSLGLRHQAIAVDMEAAIVAKWCRAHAVPFGCLRVISDRVDRTLSPQLVSLLADGRVSPWRVLKSLVRAPRLLPEMWRLGKDTALASRQLAIGLGELLTLTLPWSVE
jgi:adenosylhomocysteine nucleosidase